MGTALAWVTVQIVEFVNAVLSSGVNLFLIGGPSLCELIVFRF